ncbi:hypothetical protein ACFFU8_08950 [Chromobacterium piscinae]|uniref:hypothetical protein n=1 Tax=Chromobacterium piscinae TaxID=686831 RepID=UPI001E438293|nr:hypothetical protein [Chromobacterium piscinae]MCD5327969.1 hypothetical protein [Chromobacterium piscinae]
MQTLNNHEVYKTLRSIAETAYPEKLAEIRTFRVSIHAIESNSRHGDYNLLTREIRIFNLSRKTAHLIKTTIHELSHHIDCCFYGKTAHDKQFYTTYKHLLEVAHKMSVINLAETTDQIDSRDLAAMAKKVGAPRYETQQPKSGFLIKVDNAFAIRDQLKEHGYRFSSTEKLWILEVAETTKAKEETWILKIAPAGSVRVIALAENDIESIYFGIVGKKIPASRNPELKDLGFKFDKARGWYKRIKASEKDAFTRLCADRFQLRPSFTGTL